MSLHNRIAPLAQLLLAFCADAAMAADIPGLGKPLSEADLALWGISIAPDGKGLLDGSGTASQGVAIYEHSVRSATTRMAMAARMLRS